MDPIKVPIVEDPPSGGAPISSPPPAQRPPEAPPSGETQVRLAALARQLVITQNRQLMLEYLRLRRTVR